MFKMATQQENKGDIAISKKFLKIFEKFVKNC